MTAHIIGKNPSIETYPTGMWKDLESYGINEAAFWFGTKWGFTGHSRFIPKFKEMGIPLVLCNPFFEGVEHTKAAKASLNGQEVLWVHRKTYQDIQNLREYSDHEVLTWLRSAKAGHGNLPNWYTALHLLIFHLIAQGKKEIHLHGCNNVQGTIKGAMIMHQPEYSRKHTEKIVRLAPQVGVDIHWWENFEDYDRGTT